MSNDSLVPAGSFAALTPVEGSMAIQDIVQLNLGGKVDPSMLDRVKVPSGGSLSWEVPGLDGEPEPTKEIVGVIVGQQNVRSYWATAYTGGNEPPNCSSVDGVNGVADEIAAEKGCGGPCAECPMSKWESGKGGVGKACAERKLIFILQPDAALPIVVNIPPTSLNPVTQYLLRLTSKRVPFFHVVTGLKLRKVKNDGGIEYGVVAPGFIRVLDEEEKAAATSMYRSLRTVFGMVATEAATESEPL